MLRWLALTCATGCLAGAGPVVAIRPGEGTLALGWEAQTHVAIVGVEGGQSFSLGRGRMLWHVAARSLVPAYAEFAEAGDYANYITGGLSLGYGGARGDGGLFA